jgi:hypothetical protein
MKFPFGEEAPDFEQTALLANIGFNVSNIVNTNRPNFTWTTNKIVVHVRFYL